MSKRRINPTPEQTATMMNERGLEVYDAVVVACAKTGEIWQLKRLDDEPVHDAHAEVDGNGRIIFIVHPPSGTIGGQTVH